MVTPEQMANVDKVGYELGQEIAKAFYDRDLIALSESMAKLIKTASDPLLDRIERLRDRIERLREGLEFYSDDSGIFRDADDDLCELEGDDCTEVRFGAHARRVLKETE